MTKVLRIDLFLFFLFLTLLVFFLVPFMSNTHANSLQADFSAYYTAGESFRYGQDIYRNNVLEQPSTWDGIARYSHSRFLYFPLIAVLFAPLSLIGYSAAKLVWMVMSFGAIIASLMVAGYHFRKMFSAGKYLLFLSAALLYYPLRTVLERGQTDPFLLFFIVLAISLMRDPQRTVRAGLLLSLVVLVKPQFLLLVPFLVLLRRARVVTAIFGGLFLANIVAVAVFGYGGMATYYTKELPRILEHGEAGTDDMLLRDVAFWSRLEEFSAGFSEKDGREYEVTTIALYSNASVARALGKRLPLDTATVAFLFSLPVFLTMAYFQRRRPPTVLEEDEAAYWFFWLGTVLFILMAAPLSWSMATVCLLPLFLLFLLEWRQGKIDVAEMLAIAAFVSIAFPDSYLLSIRTSWIADLVEGKYLYGELLLALSLGMKFFAIVSRRHVLL